MSRFAKLALAALLVVSVVAVDAAPSQAGNGFGYGRYGMFGSPLLQRTQITTQQRTTSSSRLMRNRFPILMQPRVMTTRTHNIQRSNNNGYNWPGAIGAASHRYNFFQDVNGYWK